MVKTNNADAFKIQQTMMRLSGVWPKIKSGLPYHIRTALSWILGISLAIIMSTEVLHDITDITKLSEILYVMVSITIYLIKLGGFTYQRKTFVGIVTFLKDPIFTSYSDDLDHYMAKTVKLSRFITNAYRYLCLCCAVMFAVYPILDNTPLPVPFSYDVGRYHYAVYTFQVASIGSCAWNNSCLDTLTTSLMGIASAQLDILREKIIRIGQKTVLGKAVTFDDEKKIVGQIKQCINHHLAIIRLVESIEHVFTVGLLAQFLGSILVICNTLFHFILISASSSQFFALANYFAVMITQLFIYCWYGNEIMWKSVQIGQACYMSSWYNHGSDVRKYLFIIMERSKRPLVVTVLKVSNLSLMSLASILHWSYSFLALLLKIHSQEPRIDQN